MYKYLIIYLCIFSACKTSTNDQVHILIPGIGFDNIKLGITKLENIISKYGDNFRVDTFYAFQITHSIDVDFEKPIKKTIYSIAVNFDSLGLSFYFHPDQETIFSISVTKPFKAKTDKGIILGESSFNDIVKIYGDSSWYFSSGNIKKCYAGINFCQLFNDTLPAHKKILAPYLAKKVTEISINKLKTID